MSPTPLLLNPVPPVHLLHPSDLLHCLLAWDSGELSTRWWVMLTCPEGDTGTYRTESDCGNRITHSDIVILRLLQLIVITSYAYFWAEERWRDPVFKIRSYKPLAILNQADWAFYICVDMMWSSCAYLWCISINTVSVWCPPLHPQVTSPMTTWWSPPRCCLTPSRGSDSSSLVRTPSPVCHQLTERHSTDTVWPVSRYWKLVSTWIWASVRMLFLCPTVRILLKQRRCS